MTDPCNILEKSTEAFIRAVYDHAHDDPILFNAILSPGMPILRNGMIVTTQFIALDEDDDDDVLFNMLMDEVEEVYDRNLYDCVYPVAEENDDSFIMCIPSYHILNIHDAEGFFRLNVRYNSVVRFDGDDSKIIDFVNFVVMESSEDIEDFIEIIHDWMRDEIIELIADDVFIQEQPKNPSIRLVVDNTRAA